MHACMHACMHVPFHRIELARSSYARKMSMTGGSMRDMQEPAWTSLGPMACACTRLLRGLSLVHALYTQPRQGTTGGLPTLHVILAFALLLAPSRGQMCRLHTSLGSWKSVTSPPSAAGLLRASSMRRRVQG